MTKNIQHHNVSDQFCAKLMALQHVATTLLTKDVSVFSRAKLIDEMCHYPDIWQNKNDAINLFKRASIIKIINYDKKTGLYSLNHCFDFSTIRHNKKYLSHRKSIMDFLSKNPLSSNSKITDAMMLLDLNWEFENRDNVWSVISNLLHSMKSAGLVTASKRGRNPYLYSAVENKIIPDEKIVTMPFMKRVVVKAEESHQKSEPDNCYLIANMFGGVK